MPADGGAGKQLDLPRAPLISSLSPSPDDMPGRLDHEATVERFQSNYPPFLEYLPSLELRVEEITRAWREGQIDDCVTQLLTLETSSHVVGADELSLRAAALRLAVGHHQPDIGVLVAELARAARRAMGRLSRDAERG